jgi:hypothetical protein
MNACKKHWGAMRAKIEALGLSRFVASSGNEATERAVRELEAANEGGKAPLSDWDPLMAMSNNFFGRVLERVGLSMMEPDDAGKMRCPLCVVRGDFDAHNTPTGLCGKPECTIQVAPGEKPWDEDWIESCGDAMLKYAVEKGLIHTQ